MSSLNKVMIIGRLGRDPEMRYTQAGKPVCSLNVATDEATPTTGARRSTRRNAQGRLLGPAAETCSQYLAKGSLVFIEGRLSTRKYQDQQGRTATSPRFRGNASSS